MNFLTSPALPTNVLGRSKASYLRYQPDHAKYRREIIEQVARYAHSVCHKAASYEAFLLWIGSVIKTNGTGTAVQIEEEIARGNGKKPWSGRVVPLTIMVAARRPVLLTRTWECLYSSIQEIHRLRVHQRGRPDAAAPNRAIGASDTAIMAPANPCELATDSHRNLPIRIDARNAAIRNQAEALRELRAAGVETFDMSVKRGTPLMRMKGGAYSNEVLDHTGRISGKVGLRKVNPSMGKAIVKAGYNVAALAFEQAQLQEIDQKLTTILTMAETISRHLQDRDEGALKAHRRELDEIIRNIQIGIEPQASDQPQA